MNANAPIETAEPIDAAAQRVVAGRHGETEAPTSLSEILATLNGGTSLP